MKARMLFRSTAGVAALVVCLALSGRAAADTFTVTNSNPAGAGSLRQAIDDANAHPGHDKIGFAPSVDEVVVAGFQYGALQITGDVEIDGPGSDSLTVLGLGHAFEVKNSGVASISGMTIDHSGGKNVSGGAVLNQGHLVLSGVTMEGNTVSADTGQHASGGAISNTGTLTLEDSTLRRNFADGSVESGGFGGEVSGGAITNSGTMTLDHARLINNIARAGNNSSGSGQNDARGGAIENTGKLTVVDSTFEQNFASGGSFNHTGAGLGGAIYNAGNGSLTIRRSTLSGNSAFGGAAGDIAGLAQGGAIENLDPATFTIEDSTIAGNSASPGSGPHGRQQSYGGAIDNQSSFPRQSTVVGSTLSKNFAYTGSNIANGSASLSLQDTILADPRTPASETGDNCGHPGGAPSAFIKSLGYNIDSGSSCEFGKAGDRSNTDPQLKALGDNGGPTQTMAIPLSSPALDQGVSGGLTTDQRGEKRPVIVPGVTRPDGGDGSDIGAYEYQPAPRGHLRIKGSVQPGRTHVGERTCFKFKAKHPNGGPMKKAQVKLGGKRARTDERGEATICKRFKDSGVRHPRIRKRGHERAKLRVSVRP